MADSEIQKKYGYLEGTVSTVLNTLLFGIKYWAGISCGSVALLADAWHTLSDSLTSVIVIISAKISARPADREHPFGHGRTELIASLIIAVLLSMVAFEFIRDAAERLYSGTGTSYGKTAATVTVISIVSKEMMAWFAFYLGKKAGMSSLSADGWHHRSDAISSAVILAGIFLADYAWWIDSVMACSVSLILFYVAYKILKSSVSALIGEEADEKLISGLMALSDEIYPGGLFLHHVHVHRYGNHTELTFHVRLPGDLTISQAHEIVNEFENEIRVRMQTEATIHMEPVEDEAEKPVSVSEK